MLPNSKPLHLLLIDDDEDDFFILDEALQEINSGVTLNYINDCRKFSAVDQKDVDLIFLDINMPGINGIQCLKKLKESELKNVPVVMYSTTGNPAFLEQVYKSGANLFFRKPITFDALKSALRSLLQLNWARPDLITNAYVEDGAYKAFE